MRQRNSAGTDAALLLLLKRRTDPTIGLHFRFRPECFAVVKQALLAPDCCFAGIGAVSQFVASKLMLALRSSHAAAVGTTSASV